MCTLKAERTYTFLLPLLNLLSIFQPVYSLALAVKCMTANSCLLSMLTEGLGSGDPPGLSRASAIMYASLRGQSAAHSRGLEQTMGGDRLQTRREWAA